MGKDLPFSLILLRRLWMKLSLSMLGLTGAGTFGLSVMYPARHFTVIFFFVLFLPALLFIPLSYFLLKFYHGSEIHNYLQKKDEEFSTTHEARAQSLLGDFVHGLLHDLKSPLATAGMILEQSQSLESAEREKMKVLLNRVSNIVSEHRRRVTIEAAPGQPTPAHQGKPDNDLSTCSVGGVVHTLVEEMKRSAAEQGIRLSLSVPRNGLRTFIPLSFAEFSRAFSNILDNAFSAVATTGGRVDVFVTLLPSSVEVVLSDNATGVPEDILKSIEAGVPKSSKINGQGLGILGARALIESVHGALKIRSSNRGTRVIFTIPTRLPPKWFYDISESEAPSIIALDDDMEMEARLKAFFPDKEITVFDEEAEFLNAVRLDPKALPLIDLHFGSDRDGIAFILDENLSDRAVLFSGRISFDDRVRTLASERSVKVFPKECVSS